MRITDIREAAIPVRSSMRNAVFDFSEMTTSVVAAITDRVVEGKPVVGSPSTAPAATPAAAPCAPGSSRPC